MSTTTFFLIAGTAVAVVTVLVLLGVMLATSRRSRRESALLQGSLDGLQARLDELEQAVHRLRAQPRVGEVHEGVVVTESGETTTPVEQPAEGRPVGDRVVLSATVGEPLVKAAAFGHGVRRALRAETRNRIRFAMRQEIRRTRRQRRQDMKAAYRRVQAEEAT